MTSQQRLKPQGIASNTGFLGSGAEKACALEVASSRKRLDKRLKAYIRFYEGNFVKPETISSAILSMRMVLT